MLTLINKKDNLAVIKRHHNGIVFDYQVHDLLNPGNPVLARFETKAEADMELGVTRKSPAPKKKVARKKKVAAT